MDNKLLFAVFFLVSMTIVSSAIRPYNRWMSKIPDFRGRDGYYKYDNSRVNPYIREGRTYYGDSMSDEGQYGNYESYAGRYRGTPFTSLFGIRRNYARNPPFFGGYR